MSDPLNQGQGRRVIRFPCPHCGTNLKTPAERMGGRATCPQCKRRSTVPSSAPASAQEPEPEPVAALPVRVWQETRELFANLSPRVRMVFFGLLGLSLVCLVLMVVGTFSRPREPGGSLQHVLVVTCILSSLACLAILHGHGTSCPACRHWWAKKDLGDELVDSEVRPTDGSAPSAELDEVGSEAEVGRRVLKVVTYHHKHQCTYCGHRWVTAFIDEYKSTLKHRPSTDAPDEPKPSQRHAID